MSAREAAVYGAAFLTGLADKLDAWAVESRSGGWSTHQVEANRSAADDCRRAAANMRRMVLEERSPQR